MQVRGFRISETPSVHIQWKFNLIKHKKRSLKNFLSFYFYQKLSRYQSKDIPELRAGTFSQLTLHWIGHYLGLGSKINEKSLPVIIDSREAQNILTNFQVFWDDELKKKEPSVIRAVWKSEKWNFLRCAAISLLASTVNFFSMSLIGLLIDWFGDPGTVGWFNNEYDALLVLLMVLVSLFLNAYGYFKFSYDITLLG